MALTMVLGGFKAAGVMVTGVQAVQRAGARETRGLLDQNKKKQSQDFPHFLAAPGIKPRWLETSPNT